MQVVEDSRMRHILLIVALLWGSLWAQSALDPTEDERLQQTLTVRAVGMPLRDLCLQLSQRTKVTLKVDPSAQEYRACVYVKEKPLVEVMQHLAEAFGFQWQREKPSDEEPYQYRLVAPPRKTPETPPDALERFRRKVLPKVCEQQRIPIEERFQRVIQYAGQGRTITEEERQALEPVIKSVDRFNIGAWYALCQMGESEWRRLANGEALFFSTRVPTQIPPKALDDWKAVFRKEIEFLREQYGDTPQRQRDLEKLESVSELRTMIRYDADTGELKTAYEALADDNPFIIDGSRYVYTEIALWKANTPFLEMPEPEMEPPLPANHPLLSRTLKAFHEPGVDDDWFQWLSELIVQMAEATDAPVVAEYYPLQPCPLILQDWERYRPRLPQDWYKFQALLKEFDYRLRLSDAGWVIIESRARDQARENDIPHPTLQRWLFKPNRRGILTLDECAEFAVLNWQQRSSLHFYIQSFAGLHDLLEGLFVPRELDFLHGGLLYAQNTLVYLTDDRAGTVPIPENGSVHALQLYASLKPAQRAQLRGAGIPFTQLDTAQQWRFLLAYTQGNILTMDDFWLPPAEREVRAQQAYVRLVSELRTREGVRIPSDHQPPIRNLEDWKRHRRSIRTETALVRSRIWRFEFHWGGETQTVVLELPEK
jgi:hypothetical protein